MSRYDYEDNVRREIERMIALAIPPPITLRPATRQQDYGGIDVLYNVAISGTTHLQVRARLDRPDYAPDEDVTFRTTEPDMISARTYAPLMLFCWLRNGVAIHGKLVDIYKMDALLDPPLWKRHTTGNGDGTAFMAVRIEELFAAEALLRLGSPRGFADAWHGAARRLRDIMKDPADVPQPRQPTADPFDPANLRITPEQAQRLIR